MKKIILAFLFFAATGLCMAQSGKVTSAWRLLDDYMRTKETVYLMKAKEAIDLATLHEDTKNDPRMLNYRGKIYQAIFDENLKAETDKLKDYNDLNKKTLLAYQNVSALELMESANAFILAKQNDKKKSYTEDINARLPELSRHFENKGIAAYNGKIFSEALPAFEKALEINTLMGLTDTLNMGNVALVAEKSGNFEKAKIQYQKLIDIKQAKGRTYSALANVYFALKDTTGAVEVIKKGRAAFPDDNDLLITETNYFLSKNRREEAIANLKIALEKQPNDVNVHMVLANAYDNIANPKASGKDLEKPANYEEMLKEAETHYLKVLEINPEHFDALFSLGALYNNHAIILSEKADAIKDMAKFNAANDKAKAEYAKAIPFLEKAHQVNPSDRDAMNALKQIYARTGQVEKAKQISEELKK
jgi:tetratricopeptide (TPR) repeat protein